MSMSFQNKARRTTSDDDRILPLINVVFLLLIFFMLAGHLAATDPFNVEPPTSLSETEPEKSPHVVLIGGDGQLAYDGKVLEQEALVQALTAEVDGGAVDFQLKADGGAAAVRMVEIMELMRQAGVKKVRVLTVPKAL
tara:strand:+ start:765 stop:1178 length:414 start_codon:yes stop_codon:yes gene_type:complete